VKHLQATSHSVLLAATAAATAVRTANLDLLGVDYATVVVGFGAELNTNSTNVAIQFSESDDTVATNFATFDSSANYTVDNTAATIAVTHLDPRSRKRYVRLTVTPATTTNDVVISYANAITTKELAEADASKTNTVVL